MSDYREMKVIRYKPKTLPFDVSDEDARDDFEELLEQNSLRFAPTSDIFIDYVLYKDPCSDSGEFGYTGFLSKEESEMYLPVFQKLFPDCEKRDLRFVHFCWYDATEAPNYYELPKLNLLSKDSVDRFRQIIAKYNFEREDLTTLLEVADAIEVIYD